MTGGRASRRRAAFCLLGPRPGTPRLSLYRSHVLSGVTLREPGPASRPPACHGPRLRAQGRCPLTESAHRPQMETTKRPVQRATATLAGSPGGLSGPE